MRAAILLCLCLVPVPLSGQQIRGRVVESSTATPVRDATVTARAAGTSRTVHTVSDSLGRFALPVPFAGRWHLRVEHIAYATVTADSIEIAPGEQLEVEVSLAAGVIPLEPIVVRSRERARMGRLREFYDRLEQRGRSGNGHFLTREDFDRHPSMPLTHHLATMPGVRIVSTSTHNVVAMRGITGACRPTIYLDGVELGADFATIVDNVAHPETLEGVEVYRSALTAPALYGRGRCGVILLWTRGGEGGRPFSWKRLLIGVGAFLGTFFLVRSF